MSWWFTCMIKEARVTSLPWHVGCLSWSIDSRRSRYTWNSWKIDLYLRSLSSIRTLHAWSATMLRHKVWLLGLVCVALSFLELYHICLYHFLYSLFYFFFSFKGWILFLLYLVNFIHLIFLDNCIYHNLKIVSWVTWITTTFSLLLICWQFIRNRTCQTWALNFFFDCCNISTIYWVRSAEDLGRTGILTNLDKLLAAFFDFLLIALRTSAVDYLRPGAALCF